MQLKYIFSREFYVLYEDTFICRFYINQVFSKYVNNQKNKNNFSIEIRNW